MKISTKQYLEEFLNLATNLLKKRHAEGLMIIKPHIERMIYNMKESKKADLAEDYQKKFQRIYYPLMVETKVSLYE